jgi:Tol biopolymer transport system component
MIMRKYFRKAQSYWLGGLIWICPFANACAASNGLIAYPARDTSGNQNIFFVESDGTGKVQKTMGADNALPSWSPTGTKLAYVWRNPTTGASYIGMMNADGSGQHSVSEGSTPMWSPSGAWIAYTYEKSGSAEIWVMSPDGNNQRQVTTSGGHNVHPTWSPDSQQIAYASYDFITNHVAIWLVGISGANPHQLTTGTWNNLDLNGNIIITANDANAPGWDPTSGKIAFWSGVENQSGGQIWTINSDGTGRTQLTHTALLSANDDPEWSPDGLKILFSTYRPPATTQELWVMNADGSDQHKVTDNTAGPLPGDSSWQPILPAPTPATLGNMSTRLPVGTGDRVMIASFIVQGSPSATSSGPSGSPKRVLIRAAGPSLTQFGVPNALTNPRLELHDSTSSIGMNDDWQTTQIGGVITSDQVAEIQNSGLAPRDPFESALIATVAPGSYTATVQGVNGGTGAGIVEVYDLGAISGSSGSLLANISTRGFVQSGDNAMIGGFIVVTQATRVIIRAIGPSLTQFGVPDALANPQLELHDATSLLGRNDDWQTTQIFGIITSDQGAAIQDSQLAPTNPAESAIIATLQPGSYTAIVRGVNNTAGNALVEVYSLQ